MKLNTPLNTAEHKDFPVIINRRHFLKKRDQKTWQCQWRGAAGRSWWTVRREERRWKEGRGQPIIWLIFGKYLSICRSKASCHYDYFLKRVWRKWQGTTKEQRHCQNQARRRPPLYIIIIIIIVTVSSFQEEAMTRLQTPYLKIILKCRGVADAMLSGFYCCTIFLGTEQIFLNWF